jgi:hypothetical protein
MLEAIIIIVALGGLEIALWRADHNRQAEQLATLEAIWVELALLNEGRVPKHSDRISEVPPARQVDLPTSSAQTAAGVAQ